MPVTGEVMPLPVIVVLLNTFMVNIHRYCNGDLRNSPYYMYIVTHSDSVGVANKLWGGTNHKIFSRKHMNTLIILYVVECQWNHPLTLS